MLGCVGLFASVVFPTNALGTAVDEATVLHRYAAGLFFIAIPIVAAALARAGFGRGPLVWAALSTLVGFAFLISHIPLVFPDFPHADLIGDAVPARPGRTDPAAGRHRHHRGDQPLGPSIGFGSGSGGSAGAVMIAFGIALSCIAACCYGLAASLQNGAMQAVSASTSLRRAAEGKRLAGASCAASSSTGHGC